MRELKKVQLLILDDWGLSMLDPLTARDLLEVIEDRHRERATLIASQLPASHWHGIFFSTNILTFMTSFISLGYLSLAINIGLLHISIVPPNPD